MNKRVLVLVAAVLAVCSLGAFAKDTKSAKKEYNFVFIPKLVHPWYETVKAGIEQAIDEYAKQGITVKYTWDATTTADVLEQTKKLENAASKRPDAISIAILDASVSTSIINDLVASKVKVCTFDCDAPKSDRLFYCGHADNRGDGAALAKALAEKIGKKGEIAILSGTLSAPNHKERVEGFKAEIAKYPNIKVVAEYADEDSLEKAISLTENILQANPKLVGIFGCNASNPVGAARAVADAGKKGKVTIVGMDDDPETIKYINDGTIYATMVQNVKKIGYESVKNMVALADGKKLDKKEFEVGAFMVTKDTMANYHTVTGK
jgi:ribose transport system substrate-binding protein